MNQQVTQLQTETSEIKNLLATLSQRVIPEFKHSNEHAF